MGYECRRLVQLASVYPPLRITRHWLTTLDSRTHLGEATDYVCMYDKRQPIPRGRSADPGWPSGGTAWIGRGRVNMNEYINNNDHERLRLYDIPDSNSLTDRSP